MSRGCIVCREKKSGEYEATVFDLSGLEVTIHLCRQHDIELYKGGQIKFMAKYNVRLTEDPKEETRVNFEGEFA